MLQNLIIKVMKNPSPNIDDNIRLEITNWLKNYVIGLNLCPFAAHPFQKNLVEISATNSSDKKEIFDLFIESCRLLINSDSNSLSTILLAFPKGLNDFHNYLDYLHTFNEMLNETELDEHIQLASFHPEYQFDGTDKNDISNYTNRAPYPIIQLLRVAEVERAIENYGDTNKIYEENIKKMKTLKPSELEAMTRKNN